LSLSLVVLVLSASPHASRNETIIYGSSTKTSGPWMIKAIIQKRIKNKRTELIDQGKVHLFD
jgi:hypothetical protein